jgi:lipopolysaccharide export system permease protein
MNLMLKKLDQYIIHQFTVVLGLSVFGFVSIFLIVDLIENLDRFMDNKVPFYIVAQYYVYTLPYFISIGLPMSVLLSTVFSLGTMVKKNEWTAIKASGISLYRITLPLMLSGLFLSGASFSLDNLLVSYGNEKRFEIDRDYVKRKSRHKLKNSLKNIFLQKNLTNHISLSHYSIKKKVGRDLSIIDLGPELMRKRIDAKKIIWEENSNKWTIEDYSIREFSDDGLEVNIILKTSDTLIDLGITPEEIQKQARKPDELDFFALSNRIIELKSNGVDTIRWEVTRYMKISFAFTNLIVVLFGIPLVLIKEENSLSFGAGASVFVIFGYYAFIKFGQSLGFKGIIEPMLSAWIGNALFMFCGIVLLWRAKT